MFLLVADGLVISYLIMLELLHIGFTIIKVLVCDVGFGIEL